MGKRELAERGTPEFYREQVGRLVRLAASQTSQPAKLELLDIAAVFQKLAERATATIAHLKDVSKRKTG